MILNNSSNREPGVAHFCNFGRIDLARASKSGTMCRKCGDSLVRYNTMKEAMQD